MTTENGFDYAIRLPRLQRNNPGHYAADQVPERVTALLLDHLACRPA
jgi:hypothetical protein